MIAILFSPLVLTRKVFIFRFLVKIIFVYIFSIDFLGTGQGFLMPATYYVVYSYFQKKMTVAISFQVTGASLIQILMPHFITYLLAEYQLKGTILILSAIALNAFPAIILLRPIKKKSVPEEIKLPQKQASNAVSVEIFRRFRFITFS